MRRALPYQPRFNAPPRSTPPVVAAPARPRSTISPGVLVFLGVVVLFALVARTVHAQGMERARRDGFDSALAVATADSAWSRVAQSYYDSTFRGNDWQGVRRELMARAERAHDMREVRLAIEAMFARLGESHFVLVPSDAAKGLSAEPAGDAAIGDVGLEFRRLDGAVVVSRVAPGSAAEHAGVHTGWILERLGDLDVAEFSRTRLVGLSPSAAHLAELQLPLSLMGRAQGSVGSLLSVGLRDGSGDRKSVV